MGLPAQVESDGAGILRLMAAASAPRVTLVMGPQEFFAERAISAATARWRAEGLEVSELLGGDASLMADLMAAAAPDLFGSSPGIVLRQAEALDEAAAQVVARTVADEPGTPWVIHHAGGRGSTKAKATLTACADDVVKAEPLKGKAVAEFTQQEFRSQRKTVDQGTIALLIDAVGADPRALASAVAQLASDVEDTHIGREQASRYYSGHVEVKGYEIADAVARRDTAGALASLRFALHEGGTAAGLMTTTAMTTTLLRMAVAKSAPGGSGGVAEVAAALKIPDWMARTTVNQARGWSSDEIADAIADLSDLTVMLKGGFEGGVPLGEEQKAYVLEQAVMRLSTDPRDLG